MELSFFKSSVIKKKIATYFHRDPFFSRANFNVIVNVTSLSGMVLEPTKKMTWKKFGFFFLLDKKNLLKVIIELISYHLKRKLFIIEYCNIQQNFLVFFLEVLILH